MRIIVEGPKLAGKSTLLRGLAEQEPAATIVEFRDYFAERTGRLDTPSKISRRLTSLVDFLSAVNGPVLVCRFTLFFAIESGMSPDAYRAMAAPLETTLRQRGFVQVVLLAQEEVLRGRRSQRSAIPNNRAPQPAAKDLALKAQAYKALAQESILPTLALSTTSATVGETLRTTVDWVQHQPTARQPHTEETPPWSWRRMPEQD